MNPGAINGQTVFITPPGENLVSALTAQHEEIPKVIEQHLALLEAVIELTLNFRDPQGQPLPVQCDRLVVKAPPQRTGHCQPRHERQPRRPTAANET
jgi:hypothetical protein